MMTVDPRRLSEAAKVELSDKAVRRVLAEKRARRQQAEGLALAAVGSCDPAERRWIVLTVARQAEETVDKALADAGVDAWLPVRKVEAQRRGSRPGGPMRRVEAPAFPGYLFARVPVSAAVLHAVLSLDGVTGMIHAGGRPKAVGDKEINLLRRMIDDGWLDRGVQARAMRRGQSVMIRDGAMAWVRAAFEGYVGTTHVRVLAALLGRAVPVTLTLDQIVESD